MGAGMGGGISWSYSDPAAYVQGVSRSRLELQGYAIEPTPSTTTDAEIRYE